MSDFDWIDEYDTPTQHISRSTFVGSAVIEPLNAGTELLDRDITGELIRQIDAGLLPALGDNAYYPVYLPPGVSVRLAESSPPSCGGVACVPRGPPSRGPGHIRRLPRLRTAPRAAVHELFEAVTDPRGDGWNTEVAGEEIADLCVGGLSTLRQEDGGSLDIQRLWSNRYSRCLGPSHEFSCGSFPPRLRHGTMITFHLKTTTPLEPYDRSSRGSCPGCPPGPATRWTLFRTSQLTGP